ncbi:putative ATP-binding cassette transporter [Thozetella sp. PMI_491]|nr:putative ATP-binding cassette transporter [Thozetella sp. PMI_491]
MDIQSNCSFGADDAFGPVVQIECRGGFDFTLLFERAILTLLPTTVFLLAFSARFNRLVRTSVKTVDSSFRIAKLVAATAFAGLQIALLVFYSHDASMRASVSIAAATANLVVALQLIALSWIEDVRSVRPSTPLLLYLLLTTILDLAQARTLWLLGTNSTLSRLFLAHIAAKVLFLVLEAQSKRRYLKSEHQILPPESTSGIINRTFLWWINALFEQGYRAFISISDLFEIDGDLRSAKLKAQMQSAWDTRQRPERKFELVWAICRTLWWPLCQAIIPKVCATALEFTQPFLIANIITLVSSPDEEWSVNRGYGLIAATGLIYFGAAIFTLHYNQVMNRCLTMSRGALVALIYDRALLIPDGLYDEASAITLMSTDTTMIAGSIEYVHDLWAYTIKIVIGLYLLARQMGWVCIMPLLVVSVTTYLTSKITFEVAGYQKAWVGASQKRVGITSAVLSEMRSIKMMGLGRLMTDLLQKLRVHETTVMAKFRWVIVWKNVISNICYQLAPPVTFVVFGIQAAVRGTAGIDTAQAFASLAIIALLTGPFASLFQIIPSLASGMGSFDRVQEFLSATARQDLRQTIPTARSPLAENIETESSHQSNGDDSQLALSFAGVDVRPTPSADVVLRNITFDLPVASIAMVIGPVASGKSTLVKAILGEGVFDKGMVSVADRRIAYCGQTPWLPNLNIRQTICGNMNGGEVDEKWYRTCIQACALERDFEVLSNGDQTSIGSGATTLSGGQKHRVALARAVYMRAKIVVLDNVLGALDNATKRTVADALLGPDGIFRQLRTTVVLVTHSIEDLKHADLVLALADGKLEYCGSYADAVRNGIIEDKSVGVSEDSASEAQAQASESPKKLPFQTPKATDREDLKRKTGDFSLYSYYFRSIGWPKALIYLFFVILEIFGDIFGQIWLKMWSEVNGTQIALYAPVYLILPFITVLGLGGFAWSFLILIAPASSNKLHHILLKAVMRAPQSFFSATDTGSILNRFSQDMTLIESSLAVGAAVLGSQIVRAMAEISMVATGSVYVTATIPIIFAVIYAIQHIYLRTSRQLRHLDLESKSPLYSHFLETLGGLVTIRSYNWQKDNQAENLKLLDLSQRPHYLLRSSQKWLTLVMELIVAAEAVLVVGMAVGLRRFTSPGLLGVSLINVLQLGPTLQSLVTSWTDLETSLGAIARIRDFERDVKPEDKECETAEPPAEWPQQGAIEFRDVTASHNANAIVLHDVSVAIKPGQKVGICGRTGSGKSSFVATLLRLLEIDAGSVFIDNLDLASMPRDTIRERLVTLPQDPLILVGSVRFNVDPHGKAIDEAIVETLSDVGLWSALQERGGLDTDITSASLSKGQQQLLALARAMLDKGKILLLDEPTSNIDPETDATIQRLLKEKCADCTVLTVAHRMDTILGSDVVLVLEAGRIVEFGAPQELLQAGGQFAALVRG